MSVYVSAFYENQNQHRNTEFYLEKSVPFLTCNVPKIIFIEEKLSLFFQTFENAFTHFVILDTIPFQKYKEYFTDIRIDSSNEKDTIDYILLMLSKTAFMKHAIDLFPIYDTFFWIDIGIAHCCIKTNVSIECFHETLMTNILFPPSKEDVIRIPGCWSLTSKNHMNLTTDVAWYFCGGFFAGHKNAIIKFADLVEKKIIEHIDLKYIMWEVNIWFLIYLEHPELFDWYYGNHNISMLKNFPF